MKLKYSIHNKNEIKSFYAKRKNTPYLGDDWHYHDEYELYFPISGSGVRIVGDSMEYYSSNELVTHYTGKTPIENLQNIAINNLEIEKNIQKQTLESDDFYNLVKNKIEKTGGVLKLSSQ